MPAVIPWAENELQTLAADPQSRIFSDQRKITVVLQPFHLQDLKTAVRDLLNAGVNCYDKSLDGILLGYDKLKILSKSASVSAETSGVAIEIQANFYTFRPEIGCILKGVVNKISNDHVGILVYQRFNISCPRPGSDAKSSKWIGNSVVMHQEVMFKLKEKNFSGRLPFFKGKIMEIGDVVTRLSQQDKKSKKKLNENVPDELNLTEASSQVSKKNRKHKLEESEENIEVKTKKSKKDTETLKRSAENDVDVSIAGTELSSLKKKKKVSIGSVAEIDFIPRLSLDVSQLPEDLPPPNADSTHFDLTKNLSVSIKSDKKKKKKLNSPDLTAIREESADGSKSNSKDNDKSQQLNEGKTKKKVKTRTEEPSSFEDVPMVKTPKKKNSKEKDAVEFHLLPPKFSKNADTSSSKIVESTPVKDKKSKTSKLSNDSFDAKLGNDASSASVSIDVKNALSPSKAKKRSKVDNLDSSPRKEKKISKDKFDLAPTEEKKSKENKLDSSLPKEKKKSRELKLTSSPSKEKMKEIASCSVASDDSIPPGQKSFRESPKKQHSSGSPRKDESFSTSIAHSHGIEYFAASRSMMDPELGTKRSGRPVPLMFGSLEGKIRPPPESPTKLSACKKEERDSDSDSLPPKKLVISTNSQYSSDSSDSDSNQAAAQFKKTVSLPRKPMGNNSDSSNSDTAAQNRLILSMGVMQSPLKTTKSIVKHDTSESESEGSLDEDKLPSSDNVLNKSKSNTKSQKPILAPESKSNNIAIRSPSPKKTSKTNANTKNVSKGPLMNQPKGHESDSDDELETMKAALLKLDHNKHKAKTSRSKSSKLNSNDGNTLSKKVISEKNSTSKTREVLPNSSKVNSALSKTSDDSDNDLELIKSALLKYNESSRSGGSTLPKVTQGKKSKPENLDDLAKKINASPLTKPKLKASGSISTSLSEVVFKGNKKKPDIDDSDDESDTEKMKVALQKLSKTKPEVHANVSKKTTSAPVKKSKAKPSDSIPTSVSQVASKDSKNKPAANDSDDESETEVMRVAMQKIDKTKSKDRDESSKKSKAAPVKKSKVKPSDSISASASKDTKNKPDNADSDDESDTEMVRAALEKYSKTKFKDQNDPLKKTKAAPIKNTEAPHVKKTKVNPSDKISRSVSQISIENAKNKPDVDGSDDENDTELIRATLQKLKEGQILGKNMPQPKEKLKRGKSKSDKNVLPSKDNQTEPKIIAKLGLSHVKNTSSASYDSDSGPEDMNTTELIEKMRQKRAGNESKLKVVKSAKSHKNCVSEKSESINSSKQKSKKNKQAEKVASTDLQDDVKKGKSSKGNASSKIAEEQSSISVKKQKPKGKKGASADDEISDVMQRLMRQAQLSVGLK